MAPIAHVIDPDPDTVITLRNYCTTFAQWEPSAAETQLSVDSVAESSSTDQSYMAVDVRTPEPPSPPPPEPEDECMNTCYHVSSRHLVLVSPVFKRLLKKEGFSESYPSKSDGLLHINATDLDAEAFLVVLQIIHLRNKQAPRAISLELLAKIAVIVNYYDCGEAIELFTEMWIQRLKNEPFPMTYCRDLVLWIWIACVFDVEDYFKQATAVAIRESQEPLRTMNLPIREWVSNEMDLARYQAIESIVEGLHALLKDYRSATYVCPTRGSGCSFACGSFLLGALSKGMDAMGLLYPRPEVPFEHVSFNKLCDDVQNMHSPSWREYYSKGAHGCTLSAAMTALITDASAAVTGLDINFR